MHLFLELSEVNNIFAWLGFLENAHIQFLEANFFFVIESDSFNHISLR